MEEDKAGKYVRFSDVEILLLTNKSQAEEIQRLRAKMSTVVCGTCKGEGEVDRVDKYGNYVGLGWKPCPVCKPTTTHPQGEP